MNSTQQIHREKRACICADRLRPRALPRAVASLATLVLGMALITGSASAAQRRVLTGSFGGAASATVDPYPLSIPKGIAVDATLGRPSSGDVYVGDPSNHRVEKFSPSGSFILMFGKDVNKTKVEEIGSTEAERDVCTAVSGDACQQGLEGTGPGAFVANTLALAVDSSSGPSAGDVYVADTTKLPNPTKNGEGAGEGIVTKFNENGEVISSWGVGGQMHGLGQPFGSFGGVTVDTSGDLWIYGTTEEEAEVGSKEPEFQPRPLVFELNAAGSLITSWRPSREQESEGPGGIAVDAEQHVYLSTEAGGDLVAQYAQGNGELISFVAHGAEYFTSDLSTHTIDVVTHTREAPLGAEIGIAATSCKSLTYEGCSLIEAFTVSRPHRWGPLAINYSIPSDPFYISEEQREVVIEAIETVPGVTSLPAAPVSTSAATLNGTVDPEGVAIERCFFEWGESGKPYEHTASCASPGAGEIGTGSSPVAVHAQIAIQPGKSYHFRLVAANANDLPEPVQGSDVLLGPPRVDSTSVGDVTANSVTLQAEVDPQNLDTKYHFEYLTEAEFDENGESFSGPHPATSVPLSDADLGSGQEDVTVSRHLTGLLPHTVYRYRVIARNTLGEGAEAVAGPAEAFSTWGTGEFELPDGRQWEMVSPPDKRGALVEPIGEDWLIQAAAGGGRMAYITRAPSEASPAGYTLYQSNLATRGAGGGWSSRNLALPHASATGLSVGEGWEYRFFSEDLARAVVQPFGAFVSCKSEQGVAQPCLSPAASEQTPFLAADYAGAASSERCSDSCYTPLVTGAEGIANVPPETVFGQVSYEGNTCPPVTFCGPLFLDATPDAGHALLQSWVALTASPSAKAVVPRGSFYEWSAAQPPGEQIKLVSVLPGNSSGEALPASKPILGLEEGNARHVISDDGARVVFRAGNHLYLRENAMQTQSPLGASGECLVAADACTVQLDAGLAGTPAFQTANRAVSRLFFTDGSVAEQDLYEYDVEQHKLVRLTEAARVLGGSVIGAGEDGSRIYFVGNGALAPHAVAGHCLAATPQISGCNLYEMHYDGAHWEPPMLIAVLSPEDTTNFPGVSNGYPELAARVSPSGQWLAFMSHNPLTGYDNQDAVSRRPDSEVYEYDAATGRLACASCDPTGARPHGVPSDQIATFNGGIAGGFGGPGGWVAANVPGWTPGLRTTVSVYQSRYLSDSGRLFFNASDALAPKDTNKTEDVYEYEPEGVPAGDHGCSSASARGSVTFKPARSVQVEGRAVQEGAGCVGLISSGESANESAFLDATETGSEVFFLTSAKLLHQDIDTSYDVYDARECTTGSPCLSAPTSVPPPCDNEASCKPAPTPQPSIFGPSGSATFTGPGNLVTDLSPPAPPRKVLTRKQEFARALKACKRRHDKKKRATCERQVRKRFAAKSKAKARNAGARREQGR